MVPIWLNAVPYPPIINLVANLFIFALAGL